MKLKSLNAILKKNSDNSKQALLKAETYDRETLSPVIKCSICNGEQVAGFKNMKTGGFEEVMLICNSKDLEKFMNMYGINRADEIKKVY